MRKQRDQHPLEDNPFAEEFLDWINSPEGELSGEVHDTIAPLLEKADVDAKNRKIIWEDGQRLSITESVQRIHANYPDFPIDLIQNHVIGWLEMEYAPPTYSEKQLDELDRLTGKWVDDHERQAEDRSKSGKSRHS
jgi:hypothetical protein